MRQRIYDIIRSQPGISVSELAKHARTTWPNAKYHAMRLETEGLVGTRTVGRRRVCFVRDRGDERIITARGILAEPTARKLATYMVEHPRQSVDDIIAGTGESRRVVYYHLKRLVEFGLVEHALGSRYAGLRPTGLAFDLLE